MTQELANKIIAAYERVIEQVRNSSEEEHYQIITDAKMDCGICRYANHIEDQFLYDDEWIRSKGDYWGPLAAPYKGKEQNIQCLQLRVDILKTFKEQ